MKHPEAGKQTWGLLKMHSVFILPTMLFMFLVEYLGHYLLVKHFQQIFPAHLRGLVVVVVMGTGLVVFSMITRIGRLNRQLQREQTRLHDIIAHSPDPTIILGSDRLIRIFNSAAEGLLNWTGELVRGKLRCQGVLACHDSAGQSLCESNCPLRVQESLRQDPARQDAKQGIVEIEVFVRTREGKSLPVQVRASDLPLEVLAGTPADPGQAEGGVTLILRDLSLVHSYEQELEKISQLALDVSAHEDTILQAVAEKIRHVLKADVVVLTIGEQPGGFELVTARKRIDYLAVYQFRKLARGLTERVVASGTSKIWRTECPDLADQVREVLAGAWSMVAAPLVLKNRILGGLVVGKSENLPYFAKDVEILRRLASQVAIAVENHHLLDRMDRQRLETETMAEIGQELLSLSNLDINLQSVFLKVCQLFGADVAGWCIYDQQEQKVYWQTLLGTKHQGYLHRPYDVEKTMVGRAILSRQLLATEDLGQETPENMVGAPGPPRDIAGPAPDMAEPAPGIAGTAQAIVRAEGLRALLACPMVFRGKIFGAVMVGYTRPRKFSEEEKLHLSSLANQFAMVLENLNLYEQVQDRAVLGERYRLAREIHDGLSQGLGYLNLRTKYVINCIKQGRENEAVSEIEELRGVIQELYQETRNSIANLKAGFSQGGDLLDFLKGYLKEYQRRANLDIKLDVKPELEIRLTSRVELQLVRIIQEALNNVRKHSEATLVKVGIEENAGCWVVNIEDNGKGFQMDERKEDSFGLVSMTERAKEIGAVVQIVSTPGCGTRIGVTVPKEDYEERYLPWKVG